ncbi:hypothetical protein LTR28_001253, partial [Elasticomyces elasticus]
PSQSGAKLRVDNLHYDLTEDDLRELFTRIGQVLTVRLLYDRQDRSQGTAFVTYASIRDARDAIHEFDGANAHGQPIRLSLVPTAPAASSKPMWERLDHGPPRSLQERINIARANSRERDNGGGGRRRRGRSDSPDVRLSDVSKPAPEHIDRYVPGGRARDSRSPMGQRGMPREGGRRPGARRDEGGRGGGRGGRDSDRRSGGQGRPKKTQEELDAEMEDYWVGANAGDATDNLNGQAAQNGEGHANGAQSAAAADDEDIDMIE